MNKNSNQRYCHTPMISQNNKITVRFTIFQMCTHGCVATLISMQEHSRVATNTHHIFGAFAFHTIDTATKYDCLH